MTDNMCVAEKETATLHTPFYLLIFLFFLMKPIESDGGFNFFYIFFFLIHRFPVLMATVAAEVCRRVFLR